MRVTGFVSRSARTRRSNVRAIFGVTLVIALGGLWLLISQRSPARSGIESVVQDKVQIKTTSMVWQHHPIFRAVNTTNHNLAHVVVEDWSNNALPVFAEGKPGPNGNPIPADSLWPAPPHSLPSGESMWFVGPDAPTRPFTVLWLQNGTETYVNVSATTSG